MLFNTWTFLIFLAVTFAAYHFLPWPGSHRVWLQIGLLTLASYVFYAWHTPWLVIILAASTWINAYVTLRLVRPGAPDSERKKWVTFAIIANLGVLVFFKYASLVMGTFLPRSWWSHWGFDLTQIPLPVGISFFTFQGISLVVDVYRNPSVVLGQQEARTWELEAGADRGKMQIGDCSLLKGGNSISTISNQRRTDVPDFESAVNKPSSLVSRPSALFFKVAFFKAFFPQLVAGPIVKAHEFMHQIEAKSLRSIDWDDAVKKLILGFFLKMVVADNLRESTAWLHYPEFVGSSGLNLLFMLYAFSFQIFADFAGYSLIAMGLARLFGYQLPINFNFPYISQSITEFWRRWHISLSTWLREYLYIPLGGNRRGEIRTYVNLIVVMLLGGLWHGAAWSFMVWGGAHGLLLAVERLFGVKVGDKKVGRYESEKVGKDQGGKTAADNVGMWEGRKIENDQGERVRRLEGREAGRLIRSLVVTARIFIIFNLVSFLWLLFQLPQFSDAVLYVKELMAWKTKGNSPQIFYAVAIFGIPVIVYHFWGLLKPRYWTPFASKNPRISAHVINMTYAILLFLIVTNSGNPGAFIYFQF